MDGCRLFVFSFLRRRYIFIKFMPSVRVLTKIIPHPSCGARIVFRESLVRVRFVFASGVVAERARAFVFLCREFFERRVEIFFCFL